MKVRKWILAWFFCLLLLCPVTGCNNFKDEASTKTASTGIILSPEEKKTQEAFETYVQNEFRSSLEQDFIGLHFTLKDPSSYGITKPKPVFPPLTEEYNRKTIEELRKSQEQLLSLDSSLLTKKQQLLYETLSRYLTQQLALSEYSRFINLLSADKGVSSQLPITLSEFAFYSEQDVKDYLALLTQVPSYFSQALEWEKNRADSGICMADFEIDSTISQIDHFIKERENNLLIDTFDSRIESLSSLSNDQKNTYKKNNEHLIVSTVLPAFTSLKKGLSDLKGKGGTQQGLSSYEGGKEYYELLIQSMTLSDRPVSQLIKTLEKRMKVIVSRVNKVNQANPDIYKILSSDRNLTSETPKQMLSRLQTSIEKDYPPLDHVSYQVAPIPDALKDNTTAAYYMIPPLDSSEDNKIYYNDDGIESTSLFTTLAHEGYPGHLYQNNYLMNHSIYPIYSVMDLTGYKEGWAYYTEIDCAKYNNFGSYDPKYHDELVELSRCNDEFGYCLSSLTDLYVNGRGYTEEQLKKVLTNYGLDGTSAGAFYEYAVKEPGAYLQYYIGYLELLSIRQNAEKKLGKDFVAKDFHEKILETGPCYYSQLAAEMNHWTEIVKK